jgi:D-aminoacyl-tRNA deacylase
MISRIQRGIVVLLGIHLDDDESVAKKLALKLPKVRLWPNKEGKAWSAGAADLDYEILIVSQFTLYNTMKGNKPDFHLAQKADEARVPLITILEDL